MAATLNGNGALVPAPATIQGSMPGLMHQLEETIKKIMDGQVSRLASALEARIDMKLIDVHRKFAEAEHGWKSERQERESAMMALQRDMLTLTDSAVKERELIERVFQDLEMLRSRQAQLPWQPPAVQADGIGEIEARLETITKKANDVVEDIVNHKKELAAMVERSVVEISTALALKQQEEMTKIHHQIRQEHKQRLDAMNSELQDHARLLTPCNLEALSPTSDPDELNARQYVGSDTDSASLLPLLFERVERLQNQVIEISSHTESDLKAVRADILQVKSVESNKRSNLCSGMVNGWDLGQIENVVLTDERSDSLCTALLEVQNQIKETISDLHAERDDRRDCLIDLRASLTASIAESTHRVELLETDLIDVTRALKRLDQKVKDVARSRGLSQVSAPQSASNSKLPQRSSVNRQFGSESDDVDSNAPLLNPSGSFESLLEAAIVVAEEGRETALDTPQKSRIGLIRRAASANPGLTSILRRARELGEV